MTTTTREVFISLLRSFWEAHACILEVGGALSTLTTAVVLPLGEPNTDKHIVCACNVGDSLGYVYSKKYGVREFTQGSHDIQSMRDMRDALGALGPVDGNKPELGNLTLSMTIVEPGDIVFLTSDGISDNFDPVVGKFAEAYVPGNGTPVNSEISSSTQATQVTIQAPLTPPPNGNIEPNLVPKRKNKSTSAIIGGRDTQTKSHRFSLNTSSSQQKNSTKKTNSLIDPKPPVRPPRVKPNSTQSTSSILHTNSSSKQITIQHESPIITTSSRPKFLRSHTVIEPRANIIKTPSIKKYPKSMAGLPLVTGPQRHTLTLLRLEDLFCFGINGTLRPCPSARKLCHLLVDFAKMITSARRNILEQRELYYRITTDHMGVKREIELNRLQQRAARKRVVDGATFSMLPGKLDHASVVAFTVGSAIRNNSRESNKNSIFVETDF